MSKQTDLREIQRLTENAAIDARKLLIQADNLQPGTFQKMLEELCGSFEDTALQLRRLCEQQSPGTGGYKRGRALRPLEMVGSVERIGIDWLHIRINTLLPHCRFQPPTWLTETLAELLDAYEACGGQLPHFKSALLVIEEYQCPTCRRAVTADELPAMQNAFRTSIKQIVEAGQAERAKLEELQALEKKARDTFLQFQKDDIAKLEETLQEAKEAAEPDATRPEAQQLQERMQALAAELEFGALSQEEYDRMFACREELQQVRADIAAIEKATPAAGDLDSQLKATRAEIEQCKLKLQYLAQYISKRAEMTFSALKMNRVEISLYDVVKSTGEVKDAFKFTYNGRRYDWLSLSEKIRAGMEVSELMKRLTGRNYPQFVDNMESVDDLANVRPTGQVIMAKCVSKAELSVRPVKPILTTMPAAA